MTGAQDMLTLSGTPDFTPFGEFMISPIHYILLNLSVVGPMTVVNGLMTGLFACISLTALSRTYNVISRLYSVKHFRYAAVTYPLRAPYGE